MPDPYARDGDAADVAAVRGLVEQGLRDEPGNADLAKHMRAFAAAAEDQDGAGSSAVDGSGQEEEGQGQGHGQRQGPEPPPWTKNRVWTRGIYLHAWKYIVYFDESGGGSGGGSSGGAASREAANSAGAGDPSVSGEGASCERAPPGELDLRSEEGAGSRQGHHLEFEATRPAWARDIRSARAPP